ncbi:putative replication protein [Shigella flexneri]|nr:putative replication protein [Shigella flexneri]
MKNIATGGVLERIRRHRKCSFANYQVQNDGQRYALSQAKSIADELMTGCTNFAFSGKPDTG